MIFSGYRRLIVTCALLVATLGILSSCGWNRRISIHSRTGDSLLISTMPVIHSLSGSWENNIYFHRRDSIVWIDEHVNLAARVIEPNTWGTQDSTYAYKHGYHYSAYSFFQYDTTVRGVYQMYPNSGFIIGETYKRKLRKRNNAPGVFDINQLTVYLGTDTLQANGDKEIWNLLQKLDKNPKNQNRAKRGKKIKRWDVYVGG